MKYLLSGNVHISGGVYWWHGDRELETRDFDVIIRRFQAKDSKSAHEKADKIVSGIYQRFKKTYKDCVVKCSLSEVKSIAAYTIKNDKFRKRRR
jgi:hypothetical protein